MLPKTKRLKKRKDFELVFRKGKGFKEKFLILKKIENNLNQSRFGFIVGKKVSKKATVRNDIKRKLRKLVYMKLEKIKKGFDVALIAQPGLENKDSQEFEIIIDKLFNKSKIF